MRAHKYRFLSPKQIFVTLAVTVPGLVLTSIATGNGVFGAAAMFISVTALFGVWVYSIW